MPLFLESDGLVGGVLQPLVKYRPTIPKDDRKYQWNTKGSLLERSKIWASTTCLVNRGRLVLCCSHTVHNESQLELTITLLKTPESCRLQFTQHVQLYNSYSDPFFFFSFHLSSFLLLPDLALQLQPFPHGPPLHANSATSSRNRAVLGLPHYSFVLLPITQKSSKKIPFAQIHLVVHLHRSSH